jgi:hypothetical protein
MPRLTLNTSTDTTITTITVNLLTQSAHQLDTHVTKTKRNLLTQLTTKFQTSVLTKILFKPKSTSLNKKRSKTTSGFQSKTRMVSGKFQLLSKDLPRSNLTQFATQPDAQRANGSKTQTMVTTFSTQILSVSMAMMKTSSTLLETK